MQSWHDAPTYQQNNLESKSGVFTYTLLFAQWLRITNFLTDIFSYVKS